MNRPRLARVPRLRGSRVEGARPTPPYGSASEIPANGGPTSRDRAAKSLFGEYCRDRHRGCIVSISDAEGDMMRRSFVSTQHSSEIRGSAAGILNLAPSSLRRAIRRWMGSRPRDLSDVPEVEAGNGSRRVSESECREEIDE